MAHELKGHFAEMRWLARLFPLEEEREYVSDWVAVIRLGSWCWEHPEDAVALRYFALVRKDFLLMEKAAAMGDALALADMSLAACSDDEKFRFACASAEKGDAKGTYRLMKCFAEGTGCQKSAQFAAELLERAADLGCCSSFYDLVEDGSREPAQRVKVMSFFGLYSFGTDELVNNLRLVLDCYSRDSSNGRLLFEVGEMLLGKIEAEVGKVFGRKEDASCVKVLLRTVAIYDACCNTASEGCVAWILVAKRLKVNKDVRTMISKMVWRNRREGMASHTQLKASQKKGLPDSRRKGKTGKKGKARSSQVVVDED